MLNGYLARRLAVGGIVLWIPLAAHAQGIVAGTVTGAPPAEPLAGVRVTVIGTSRAAVTNDSGQYRIVGLSAGDYVVAASVLGREPRRQRVHVAEGGTATADFAMPRGSYLLSGVVVTAARAAQAANEVAATVNVLAPEQVRTSPARTTDDLLREMPGVELPRTSSTVSGPEQIVSIRGADEGRTLVLLDEVPLNDPWGEWIQWNRAPRFQLDRVEVLEGGGSSLYGNYAMGGVISLLSQPIVTRGYGLMASGGSRGTADLSLYASNVTGRLGYSVGGDYGTGGGYTLLRPDLRGTVDHASEATRRSVNGRAEYALGGAGTLFASASYFDDDRSLGTALTAPNQRRITSGVVGGNLGGPLGGQIELRAYGQRQKYDSHSSRVDAARTSESPLVAQHIPSHDLGGSAQWSRQAGIFQTIAVGADFRHMVGRLDEDLYGGSGTVEGSRTSGGSQQVGGAFVRGVLAPSEPLRIEASARVDAWRSYDGSRTDSSTGMTAYPAKSNSAFAPRIGVRYALHRSLTVRGSYYQAFRAPTLSEQYRTFFAGPNTFMGNPDLRPEHLAGYDVGIDWQPVPAIELRATAFSNRYRDLDNFEFKSPGSTPGSAILQRQNQGAAKARGVEGEVALRLLDELTLAGSYNYDDARVTSTGRPVNRVPLQRVGARLTYDSPRVATLNAIYRFEGRNHSLSGAELSSFAVVDLEARRAIVRGTDVFVAVENLFDREYVVNVAGPLQYIGVPRTVRGGVSVRSF